MLVTLSAMTAAALPEAATALATLVGGLLSAIL